MNSKLLEIKDLEKKYITKKNIICAIKNINLSLYDQEFISIVGPSGCGKSTLLSIVGKLEKESNGEIIYNKKNIKIGYMFQEDALFPWLTVLDNCLLGLKIKKQLSKKNIKYVKNLLKKYGLSNFENWINHIFLEVFLHMLCFP